MPNDDLSARLRAAHTWTDGDGESFDIATSDLLAAADLLDQQAAEIERMKKETLEMYGKAWGALNFILAFYEPGQTSLDTNAWKQAEAGGRRVHAELRRLLDAAKPTMLLPTACGEWKGRS